jgi:hypothetical protein
VQASSEPPKELFNGKNSLKKNMEHADITHISYFDNLESRLIMMYSAREIS